MRDNAIKNRYDFVIFYDVKNGNPNGDPDSGNMPRIDPETRNGVVTDVCLKRKIRNYVQTVKAGEPGYRIYIRADVPLNVSENEAFVACGVDEKELKTNKHDKDIILRDWMCDNFYDIRTFGAVMTTFTKNGLNCGHLRGPVQLEFSESVEPIAPREISMTRMAITRVEDAERKTTEMGNKYIVPYGLYRCEGHVSANLAESTTGFSEDDLDLLWEAIMNMFVDDYSSGRGKMTVRKLIVFKHESKMGNVPDWKLLEAVKVERVTDSSVPARHYSDYRIFIDKTDIPNEVEVFEML